MCTNNGIGMLEQLSRSFSLSQSSVSFYRTKQGDRTASAASTAEEVLFVTKSSNNILANSIMLKADKRFLRAINKATHTSCFEQCLLIIA